ncbi:acetyl-CoA C-acyltransferase [Pseudonocardia sp. GCM10023141]|uniref:acetyl-CoA C-acyltransferase n=1 Tax=Pseudonocardia sp. GCM10023141 TaxID=3252653 RepID=UPI0036129A5D
MTEAYVVAAVRSPITRRRGPLSEVHPVDLAATVLAAAVERAGVDPAAVDDVILGCVGQVGAQAYNIARTAALSAGLPESVPGVTVDRQCGSSQQAVQFAAQAIRSGDQDVVIAGGVEVMSLVSIGASGSVELGMGHPRGGQGWAERFAGQDISQFRGANTMAERWGLTREDLERFALRSHQRAATAIDGGRFDDEIVAIGDVKRDNGARPDTTLEKMASLHPVVPGAIITAAVSSQISDGAAALVLASGDAVDRFGLTPLARVHATTVVGSDPVVMLSGPIPATERVLQRTGLSVDDIDLFEINEAFASVPLAWQRELGVDPEKVNVLGGAIALGHPLGATGARLMTTMVHELRRRGGRYGLQTICEGGGMANATIIEAV